MIKKVRKLAYPAPKPDSENANISEQYSWMQQSILDYLQDPHNSQFPSELTYRFSYTSGSPPVGWLPEPDDLIFEYHEESFSPACIRIADELAEHLGKSAFFRYQILPKGGPEIAASAYAILWIIEFTLKATAEWGIDKGLDALLQSLQDKKGLGLAEQLAIEYYRRYSSVPEKARLRRAFVRITVSSRKATSILHISQYPFIAAILSPESFAEVSGQIENQQDAYADYLYKPPDAAHPATCKPGYFYRAEKVSDLIDYYG